jgi:hypothetical protein
MRPTLPAPNTTAPPSQITWRGCVYDGARDRAPAEAARSGADLRWITISDRPELASSTSRPMTASPPPDRLSTSDSERSDRRHRYNRGIERCQNDVRAKQGELEDRVLGGLEARFLTPENVDYVVEQAVRIVREERSDDRTRRDERRLFQLEGEIDNLIELAATQGTNERVALAIGDREREVAGINSRLARRKAPRGSEALASRVRRTVSDLGNMFHSSPEDARKALGALLGENRLRVKRDPKQGFSVFGEGVLCFGGAGDRTRTCTSRERWLLRPLRLPIPPPRQGRTS